jgi:hypothetical protein
MCELDKFFTNELIFFLTGWNKSYIFYVVTTTTKNNPVVVVVEERAGSPRFLEPTETSL